MAWNEPGRGGKDPWGGRNGKKGPPDLDDLLRRFRGRLRKLRGGGGNGGGGAPRIGWRGIAVAVVVIVGLWLVSGFYQVDSAERALVLRFGAYQATVGSGLHWHLPYPIESVRKINVDAIRSVTNRAPMLTQGQDLVEVSYAVQYRVKDPEDFAFNVTYPEDTLRQITRSAIRRVVGTTPLTAVLDASESKVADRTRDLLQKALDAYGTGIQVTAVHVQEVQPPEPVREAFADVIAAREDKQRMENEANAYASRILPRAHGEAARRIEEAKAYKARVVNRAQGEASRFTRLLEAYRQAPEITRSRMYLNTMDRILDNATTVLAERGSSGPVLRLSVDGTAVGDRAVKGAANGAAGAEVGAGAQAAPSGGTAPASDDEARARSRGSR